MSPVEWESLCDGCGKCCVLKLEDVDTNIIYSTDVGCKLLDCDNARCRHYADRKKYVPDCVVLTPDNLSQLSWMPKSCAFQKNMTAFCQPILCRIIQVAKIGCTQNTPLKRDRDRR